MPVPTSVSEFLDLTQRSGVVDEGRLTNYIQQLRAANAIPIEPNKLAGLMVRDGLLTYFQAEQLLMGKWKRFTIGRYKVLEKIGSGGMGQVFLCEHVMMRRRVAVKVLPTAKAEEESSLERFKREARAVASLDHLNIVRAYDLDQDGNLHFLVMEFVDGSNLQEIVKKTGPMSPIRACHYIYQSALGLQHAFDRAGLIHRDIKPGNILVDRTGVVKILDMGLARFFHDEDDLLTKKFDENVLGTADYLAPEQALDSHSVDIRADIYSLGATFYFMLTGNPPFVEGTVTQKLIWHQQKEPKPVTDYRNDVPAEILAILNKMLAKNPDERYQVPVEVAEALAPFVQMPIEPPPESEMPKLSPAATGILGGMPTPAPRVTVPPTPAPVQRPLTPAPVPRPPTPAPMPAMDPVRPPSPEPRTVISANASAIAPAPVVTVPQEKPVQVWSQITSDTARPNAVSDTAVNRPVYKPPSTMTKLTAADRAKIESFGKASKKRWFVIVGGILVAVVAVIAVSLTLSGAFGKKEKEPNRGPLPGAGTENAVPTTWTVDAAATPQGNTVQRVYQALAKAKSGDRILVKSDVRELFTMDWKRVRGISIEADSQATQPITWRLPAEFKSQKSMLDLSEADGVQIKGFIFDGENRADHGIYMAFACPGVIVEDVQFINCNKSAIMLSNVAGEPSRPMALKRLHVRGNGKTEAGITLFSRPKFTPELTQFVQIEDCIFEGTPAAVLVQGSADDVKIRDCRIFRGANGILVKASDGPVKAGLTLKSNTFHSLTGHAVYFDAMPASGPVNIEQNYFANCKSLVGAKDNRPVSHVTAKANARNAASAEGTTPIQTQVIEFKFPVLDPSNRREFLRYPKDAPLATATGGPFGSQ